MQQSICMEMELERNMVSRSSGFSPLRRFFGYLDGWRLATCGIALFTALPLIVILFSFLQPEPAIWRHLSETLLADLVFNTVVLVSGVLAGTFLLGVSLAWLTGVCDFPGRGFFSWALLLPLAVPTYVLAFVFIGIFDFSGPVQSFLRAWSSEPRIWFPNIRSTGGVILVMTLALYPYVYFLCRSAFKTQGKRALEAAQSLGYSRWSGFYKVALPMARPWIAGSLMLVLMETLADFGAVSIFNFDTFTTAIYKSWYGFFSLPAAAQLSSLLVLLVFVVMVMEHRLRGRKRFTQSGRLSTEREYIVLIGWKRWMAFGFAMAVLLIGFVVPVSQLLFWCFEVFSVEFDFRYFGFVFRSIFFAFSAALAITICAMILSYAQRLHTDRFTKLIIRISTLGYALPGTVLAVGIFIVFAFADNTLIQILSQTAGISIGPLIQGTFVTVIAAYLVRFMAAGFNSISSAMQRVTPNLDEASISMGITGLALLRRVHLPILKSGLFTAAILVFVDVMKEMPITLMLRPFGWDTLAVKIYELTSEGEWERAAFPALALILAGLIPVAILTRKTESSGKILRGIENGNGS